MVRALSGFFLGRRGSAALVPHRQSWGGAQVPLCWGGPRQTLRIAFVARVAAPHGLAMVRVCGHLSRLVSRKCHPREAHPCSDGANSGSTVSAVAVRGAAYPADRSPHQTAACVSTSSLVRARVPLAPALPPRCFAEGCRHRVVCALQRDIRCCRHLGNTTAAVVQHHPTARQGGGATPS